MCFIEKIVPYVKGIPPPPPFSFPMKKMVRCAIPKMSLLTPSMHDYYNVRS